MRPTLLLATLLTAAAPPQSRLKLPILPRSASSCTRLPRRGTGADLDRHVAPYADSATMMGGRGLIRGRPAIRALLERGFWRDRKPLQQLRFEEIVVRRSEGQCRDRDRQIHPDRG